MTSHSSKATYQSTASGNAARKPQPGVFCDCLGTLFGPRIGKNMLLVRYLNAQHAAGRPVVIFSTDPGGVATQVAGMGLHEEIACVVRKDNYRDAFLEEVVDDNLPSWITAQKHWDPHDPLFRAHVKTVLSSVPGADRFTP